jgi:ferrous iron transport protein A
MTKILDLTQLKPGQKGIVIQIQGGAGLISRLQTMGIRPGKNIIKISAQIFRGPQIVKVDNLQVAIGFGMARRVLVEVEE